MSFCSPVACRPCGEEPRPRSRCDSAWPRDSRSPNPPRRAHARVEAAHFLGHPPRHHDAAAVRDDDAAIETQHLRRHRALHPVDGDARALEVDSRNGRDRARDRRRSAPPAARASAASQASSESRKATRSPRATGECRRFAAAATP
jgi:hypothetical protein